MPVESTDRGTGTGRFSFFSQTLPSRKGHSQSYFQSSLHRPQSASGGGAHLQYGPPGSGWPAAPTPPTSYTAQPPPQQYPGQPRQGFACNICTADLNFRPRITCHECPNFDICSTCYLTQRAAPPPHEPWHKQQTVPPAQPLRQNPKAGTSFNCDNCGVDISAAPRARCLECINLDLCGDCHIIQAYGPPGQGHAPTHKMNVITNWQPETIQPLVGDDYYPSNLYLDMIEAIFNFIHKNYNPSPGGGVGEAGFTSASSSSVSSGGSSSAPDSPRPYATSRSAPGGAGPGGAGAGVLGSDAAVPREQRVEFEVLEASKLARFYRAMGMIDKDNSYLTPAPTLSKIYSRLGLEYILIPSPSLRASLSDRVFPWQVDHLDTTPTEPALTRAGFRRSFVLGTFLNPDGTFYILQNLLSTGMLVNPISGVPFRSWVPREVLPRAALGELVEWERSLNNSY